MIGKLYRKLFEIEKNILSKCRILHLRLKYPHIKITTGPNTYIGKNCDIVCVDRGTLILDNVYISNGVHIMCQENALVNLSNCFIGRNSIIVSLSQITILSNAEIAEFVVIRDQNHNHNLTDTPIKNQSYNIAPILINENVWIGAKTTILKGVEIGRNSVIGAHSLVNKNIPSSSIFVGTPAKPLKLK